MPNQPPQIGRPKDTAADTKTQSKPRRDGAKVALITGGARRIGACIAQTLHRLGYVIALHYRGSQTEAFALATKLQKERPESVYCFQADLSLAPACESLVDAVYAQLGRIDVLINNASTFYATPLGSIRESEFDDLIATNLKAPLFLTQRAAPILRDNRGVVVNITDIHASRPKLQFAPYSAAKAGLANLTVSLARELAPEVRVNAVAPGTVLWPEQSVDHDARQKVIDGTALRRTGSPQDVADAVAYLLTSAGYTTGQTLVVDGGRELGL